MENRTAAIIITIFAILLCGCPGLAFAFLGALDFIDYYGFRSLIFGTTDQTAVNVWGSLGICAGIVFVAIAVVVSVLVLRRKREMPPTNPQEPLPPPV